MNHKVKSWSHLFQAIVAGGKKHDIRDMRDRDYKLGDMITLQEFDIVKGKYTGREADVKITYMTNRDTPCAFSSSVLDRNFAILSIELKAFRA